MNKLTSKDRLGYNGLVNKGLDVDRDREIPSFEDVARRTKLNGTYNKKWIHMDEEKPHHYFTTNAWAKSRNKSFSSTLQPGTKNRIIST